MVLFGNFALNRKTNMLENYLPLIVMIAVGLIFGLSNIFLAQWLGPRRTTRSKLTTYESGMEPIKTARERFTIKFYLVAMMFILFDIEIIFMYPWAVQFRELGMNGFIAMILFMVLLFSGYIYVWKKGTLEWD
ncbi:MAG: NAD(P)H-quinone oxidoreductase subunit 3, chloroplastic [Chlorobi bacterium]|nr:MAG: NADH dehydrogenase I subunit A [Chlorobi bacterium OLB6]MBV6464654.1 NAD(P)H-quinone oxidoreductase subunit 3, chloroplastic [Chlorobiota bacterium]